MHNNNVDHEIDISMQINQQGDNQQQLINKTIDQSKKNMDEAIQKMQIKNLLRRFVQSTRSRMYKFLKTKHFEAINDQSIINKKQYKAEQQFGLGCISKYFNVHQVAKLILPILKLLDFIKLIPVFSPSSNYKLMWDFIMIMSISYLFFVIPINLSFDIDYEEFTEENFVYVTNIVILVDMIITLNSGFYNKGILIVERWEIIKNYVKNSIITEIIGCLFIAFNFLTLNNTLDNTNLKTIRSICLMLFFIKINHFTKIAKRIEERFLLSPKVRNILKFIKLLASILIISHIYACVWIYFAEQQNKVGQDNWYSAKGIVSEQWQIKYCYSYYFITVTMATVGYGDITPTNNLERIVNIIIIITACGVFGYTLNTIGVIIQEIYKAENEKNQNMYTINYYMNKKSISQDLQYQVRQYLEYYYQELSSQNQEKEKQILSQLSDPLRRLLLYNANKIILSDSPVFSKNFSQIVIQKSLPLIEQVRVTPEEVIFWEGEADDGSIYFIEKGQMEIFMEISQEKQQQTYQKLKVLGKGESFGEISFFTGFPRECNIRSTEFTTLLKINRQSFINLLKSYQEDYEMYCHIRDTIIFNCNYKRIGLKCYSCDSTRHQMQCCPYLHFVRDFKKIQLVNSKNSDQQRQNYERQQRGKSNNFFKNHQTILFRVQELNQYQGDLLDAYEQQYLGQDINDISLEQMEQDQIINQQNEDEIHNQHSIQSRKSNYDMKEDILKSEENIDSPFTETNKDIRSKKSLEQSMKSLKIDDNNNNKQSLNTSLIYNEDSKEGVASEHLVKKKSLQFNTNYNENQESMNSISDLTYEEQIKQIHPQQSRPTSHNRIGTSEVKNRIIQRRSSIMISLPQQLALTKKKSSSTKSKGSRKTIIQEFHDILNTFKSEILTLNNNQAYLQKEANQLIKNNDFDEIKIFCKYMPWNNFDNVLQLIKLDKRQFRIELNKKQNIEFNQPDYQQNSINLNKVRKQRKSIRNVSKFNNNSNSNIAAKEQQLQKNQTNIFINNNDKQNCQNNARSSRIILMQQSILQQINNHTNSNGLGSNNNNNYNLGSKISIQNDVTPMNNESQNFNFPDLATQKIINEQNYISEEQLPNESQEKIFIPLTQTGKFPFIQKGNIQDCNENKQQFAFFESPLANKQIYGIQMNPLNVSRFKNIENQL